MTKSCIFSSPATEKAENCDEEEKKHSPLKKSLAYNLHINCN